MLDPLKPASGGGGGRPGENCPLLAQRAVRPLHGAVLARLAVSPPRELATDFWGRCGPFPRVRACGAPRFDAPPPPAVLPKLAVRGLACGGQQVAPDGRRPVTLGGPCRRSAPDPQNHGPCVGLYTAGATPKTPLPFGGYPPNGCRSGFCLPLTPIALGNAGCQKRRCAHTAKRRQSSAV